MQYLKAFCVAPCIPGESQAGAKDWSKGLWGLHSIPPEGRCWGVSKRVFKGRERSFLKSLCTFPSLPLFLPKHAPKQWVTAGCHRLGIPTVLFSTQKQPLLTTQTWKTRSRDNKAKDNFSHPAGPAHYGQDFGRQCSNESLSENRGWKKGRKHCTFLIRSSTQARGENSRGACLWLMKVEVSLLTVNEGLWAGWG